MRRPSRGDRLRAESFAAALDTIRKHYVGETDPDELYRAALTGMVGELDDRFSTWLTPAQYRESRQETRGEFGGIGVSIQPHELGLIVVKLLEPGPSQEAGVRVGDIITGVEGRVCKGLEITEIVSMIRGPVGKPVTITVRRNGHPGPLQFTIRRAKIEFPFVEWRLLKPGVGCIEFRLFDDDCDEKFRDALDDLGKQGMKVLILDLRGNVGGLLEQCVRICDMFLSGGAIVRVKGRIEEETNDFMASERTVVPAGLPVLILVDGQTASAAEILAGALQDHGRARLVGTPTFGKAAVNRIYVLPDRSAIVLTVAHYTTPNGRVISKGGLKPDVVVGELPPWKEDGGLKPAEWLKLYNEAREKQMKTAEEIADKLLQPSPTDP
jgi:carboxyl-terminal processing protease